MRSLSAFFSPKISLEQLSHFCGSLGTCVSAGLDIPKSLTTCQRSSPSPLLREILVPVASQTARGMKLCDALEPHKRSFPGFFLPVLRGGEESGRLDQTLHYLEGHCRLLAGPARTMRNMWFVPLCLLLVGTGICGMIYWALAPRAMAIQFLVGSLKSYLVAAVVVAAALYVPPLRIVFDYVRLVLPVIGPAERELTINRFFHCMNLLYATGGRRVEAMIRLAADAAENQALRGDFLRAADVIVSGGTISVAFSAVTRLPFHYQTEIMAGEEAGKLEEAFDNICRDSGESVVSLLSKVQPVFFRIVAMSVMISIYGTIQALAFLRR